MYASGNKSPKGKATVKWHQKPVTEAVRQLLGFGVASIRKFVQQPASDLINQLLNCVLSALWIAGSALLKQAKKPIALVLSVLVPLLVMAYHHVAMGKLAARQPAHLSEIIDELASIRIPSGKVVPNHANTKLLYAKYTVDDTWALFLHDIGTQKSRVVSEVGYGKGSGSSELAVVFNLKILGWSPDDRCFAYVRNNRKEVVICDGNSGAELGKGMLDREVKGGVWPSSRMFLCSDGMRITEFSPKDQSWGSRQFYGAPEVSSNNAATPVPALLPAGEIQSLAAWQYDSAVWQQSNAIYACKQGRAPQIVWQATNCELVEFSFPSRSDKFLLHLRDKRGEFLVDYHPRILLGDETITNEVRLEAGEYRPIEAQLINGGKGYAYLNRSEMGLSRLVIKPTRTGPPVELPWKDEVRGFAINHLQLFVITSNAGEPPGIWRCDLSSGSADCLVPSMDKPVHYAKHAPVSEGYVTNGAGERLTYYLLQPTKSDGQQKRPLVVGVMGAGESGYTWDRLAQLTANCGGYFVCVDRQRRSYSDWAEDAFCTYEFLSKNFGVDTNNVYLLGLSAGNGAVVNLLKTKSAVWKGAFLVGMGEFPSGDHMRACAIALDVGALELKSEARLLQSQDRLAAAGIRPTLMIRPGVGHLVRTIGLERERMAQFAAFINQP